MPTNIMKKMQKLDLQMQKFVVKNFKPTKGKAAGVLMKYVERLGKFPQKWRLETIVLEEDPDVETYWFDL